MPLHTVILNYDPTLAAAQFGPNPRQIRVRPNDTVQFQIGASTLALHPGCRLRITIHQDQHFSPSVVQHQFGQNGADGLIVSVRAGLAAALAGILAQANPRIAAYRCELLRASGEPIPGLVSEGAEGGEIVPDTGAGG